MRTLAAPIAGLMLLGILLFLSGCGMPSDPGGAKPPPLTSAETAQTVAEARHGRALSLRMLQERWRQCAPAGSCPPEVLQLGGIRRVLGFIVDRETRDVILIGSIDPSLPPIESESFAIALRNAMYVYAERKGNVIEYAAPSVSIDPKPAVMKQLASLSAGLIDAKHGLRHDVLEQWRRVCTAPQKVTILGVPVNSRFAWIAVTADYDAKRLLDGSDVLNVAGFSSVLDRRMAQVLQAIRDGREDASGGTSMNRIWFAASDLQVLEDSAQGTLLIGSPFRVVVRTEAEHINREGGISGTGKEDPTMSQWTRDFTQHYRAISRERVVYAQLEGLFRLVALSAMLRDKKAFETAGLDPEVLLRTAPIAEVAVKTELEGCFNVRHHPAKPGKAVAPEDRHEIVMPSCGGVGMDIRSERTSVTPDRGMLVAVRDVARTARPAPGRMFWDY